MDWDPTTVSNDGYVCPPCPIFYPTWEEFKDPLKYISSIRHIGMKAGICKIVPPQGWQPPYAINEKTFRFRTRVQQLNCIEGHTRAEGNFVESLRMFLYRNETPMKELPRIDGQLVNLSLLYRIVAIELGGYENVCTSQQWPLVVRRVGRTRASDSPNKTLCCLYQQHYKECLLAYEQHENKKQMETPIGIKTEQTKHTKHPRTTTPSVKIKQEEQEVTSPDSKRVKRTLFSDTSSSEENEDRKTKSFEPEVLKPDSTRQCRLPHPEIIIGQQFYQYFQQTGAIRGEIQRIISGKKRQVIVKYPEQNTRETIEWSLMEIILANGWNAEAAELAFKSEICQTCLRGDCWDSLLLCDGCNSGHHMFCLDTPLTSVPPGDWYCTQCLKESLEMKEINPKFGFEMGSEYTLETYKAKADAWKRSYFQTQEIEKITDRELEQEYWRILKTPVHEQRLEVEYGSDIDSGSIGSGFPRCEDSIKTIKAITKRLRILQGDKKNISTIQYELSQLFSHGLNTSESLETIVQQYAQDDWNLNNLPKLSGSVLQYLDEDIKGVMIPWVYIGMCFSTFCWHVEDHNFYSISYLHGGAPKTWYGVPCDQAEYFESVMKQLTPELFGAQPDLHLQLVTMFSPDILRQHGVPVYRATHGPNEFIVTFPNAYHGGFNNGFNCAEAVNFATPDWLSWGAQSIIKYRNYGKLPVFAHEALVLSLVETMMDSTTIFNYSAAKHYCQAVEQLIMDFKAFELSITTNGIVKRESMDEYTRRHGLTDGTGDSMNIRSSKMMKITRPTRMVLWAGTSGKSGGLRCITCKQYCYLQAVVCTKCRHHIGCMEHYSTMCKCNAAEYYQYLYRYETMYLPNLLQEMYKRMEKIEEWIKECQQVLNHCELKTSMEYIKQLYVDGKSYGGPCELLKQLQDVLNQIDKWTERAETLYVQSHQMETNEELIQQIIDLLQDAKYLYIIPDKVEMMEQLLQEQKTLVEAESVDTAFCFESERDVIDLWRQNEGYQRLVDTLDDIYKRSCKIRAILPLNLIREMEMAQHYFTILINTNEMLRQIAAFTQSEQDAVQARDCRYIVDESHYLVQTMNICIFKVDILTSLLKTTEMESIELQQALENHSKSTEELSVLWKRLRALPIWPDQLEELTNRLALTREWEETAKKLLETVSHRNNQDDVLMTRPLLNTIEQFYQDADRHFVPTSSLLRRQIHSRVHDCRRWSNTVYGLFVRQGVTEDMALEKLLRTALKKITHFDSTASHEDLLCICNQVICSSAQWISCRSCQRSFHPQCVGFQGHEAFICLECLPSQSTRGRRRGQRSSPPQSSSFPTSYPEPLEPLFCSCRGPERMPMICCDICDEWYHCECIGMNIETMDHIEVYRCQRCTIQQHLYYLDKKMLRQNAIGRRPGFSRVETMITQLQTLIALPPGATELLNYMTHVRSLEIKARDYIEHFTSSFTVGSFTNLDYVEEETKLMDLMRQITLVEVNLDTIQGRLIAIHWSLRACKLVLISGSTPKYSHLVLLLNDASQPNFIFPRPEYHHIQQTIQDNVQKAHNWLQQALTLEVEEWNVEKAQRLVYQYQDLSSFLEMPITIVELVYRVAGEQYTSNPSHCQDVRVSCVQ